MSKIINEDIISQPDLFDKEISTIYNTDKKRMYKVLRNKDGSKTYLFGTKYGKQIRKLGNEKNAAKYIAKKIAESNELSKIFEFANNNDKIVFVIDRFGKNELPKTDLIYSDDDYNQFETDVYDYEDYDEIFNDDNENYSYVTVYMKDVFDELRYIRSIKNREIISNKLNKKESIEYQVRCESLSDLNNCLRKLILKEDIIIKKSPFIEADGNFTSIISSNDKLSKSGLPASINMTQTNELSPKKQEEKEKLTQKALENIKNSLSLSDELQAILNQINKINKSDESLKWTINEKGNTAELKNKNASIFIQNNNICLSYNNKINIFKSVKELHEWLKNHNLPLPKGIKLHEDFDLNDFLKKNKTTKDGLKIGDKINEDKLKDELANLRIKKNKILNIIKNKILEKNAKEEYIKLKSEEKNYDDTIAILKNELNGENKPTETRKKELISSIRLNKANLDKIKDKIYIFDDEYNKEINNIRDEEKLEEIENRIHALEKKLKTPEEIELKYNKTSHKMSVPEVKEHEKWLPKSHKAGNRPKGLPGYEPLDNSPIHRKFIDIKNDEQPKDKNRKKTWANISSDEGQDILTQKGQDTLNNVNESLSEIKKQISNILKECGICSTTSNALGSDVQFLASKNKKKLEEEELEEDLLIEAHCKGYENSPFENNIYPDRYRRGQAILRWFLETENPTENYNIVQIENWINLAKEDTLTDKLTAKAKEYYLRSDSSNRKVFKENFLNWLKNNKDENIKFHGHPGFQILIYALDNLDWNSKLDIHVRDILYLDKELEKDKEIIIKKTVDAFNEEWGTVFDAKEDLLISSVKNKNLSINQLAYIDYKKKFFERYINSENTEEKREEKTERLVSAKLKQLIDKNSEENNENNTEENTEIIIAAKNIYDKIKNDYGFSNEAIKNNEIEPLNSEEGLDFILDDLDKIYDEAGKEKFNEILNLILNPKSKYDISKFLSNGILRMIKRTYRLTESLLENKILSILKKKVLTEDDSPADFATGTNTNNSLDINDKITSTDNTENPLDNIETDDTFEIDQNSNQDADLNDFLDNSNFGGMSGGFSGYNPEDEESEEGISEPTKEFRIIDVLANDDNPDDINVKIQDIETGEIQIRKLYELDI